MGQLVIIVIFTVQLLLLFLLLFNDLIYLGFYGQQLLLLMVQVIKLID